MTDIRHLRRALTSRLLGSGGVAPVTLRQAAFEAYLPALGSSEALSGLVEKVAYHSGEVTDEDFAAVCATGLSEDEIFEVVVCAAAGQANRQYDSALAALARATGETGASDEA
jgi:hypothetical protein